MKQEDLVKAVAAEAGTSNADAERVLKALGNVTQSALKGGGEVTLPGLGKLSVTAKQARTGRNPQTGETIQIAAKNAAKFSAAKALKDALN